MMVNIMAGWWFQTWLSFSIIYGMSSTNHWRTHIFQDGWNHQPVFVFIHRVCTIIVLLYTIVHYYTLYIHCTYSTSLFVWVKARHVHGCWLCVMCVCLKSGYAHVWYNPLLTHHLSCQTGHVWYNPWIATPKLVKSQSLMVQSPLKTAFNWWFPELFHPNIIPSILFFCFPENGSDGYP